MAQQQQQQLIYSIRVRGRVVPEFTPKVTDSNFDFMVLKIITTLLLLLLLLFALTSNNTSSSDLLQGATVGMDGWVGGLDSDDVVVVVRRLTASQSVSQSRRGE